MNKNNLWILTEERPKSEVIKQILDLFARDYKIACFVDTIRILPILENGQFTFLYEVVGFNCNKINKVLIKTISGYSSFVDFLIFFQVNQPTQNDIPLYAIEETKTDDKESRNTGVYQRATKFVFIDHFYPNTKKIMLYNLSVKQNINPTSTYKFGTKLLLTLGVIIHGKALDKNIFTPFDSIDEIIEFKNNMRRAPKGNTPILIKKYNNTISISGRLFKSGSLSHDPNIGALSLISAAIRKLGWRGNLLIKDHHLKQNHLKPKNKFVIIANFLGINIDGLSLPKANFNNKYWKYENKGEKLGTIFIHLVIENFTEGYSIYENHAGCERGYFLTKEGECLQIKKYSDREAYKAGNKKKRISIPDLIIMDFGRGEIINIEGKTYQLRHNGIREIKYFDDIENLYIKRYYPDFKIIRTVVLYGGKEKRLIEIEIGFLLNENGDLVLGIRAPEIFREAIKNLIDFWS